MATEGQRVVLITGCSSGIGMGIAVHLARDDNQRLSSSSADPSAETGSSSHTAEPGLTRQSALVNNAGVGLVGPVEGLSMDDMANVFETNFYGAVRMIKEVMPDMKRRRSGHIVVISSVAFNDVYSASKFAIEGFCESLAVQLLKFNVTVSMIEPGPVHTEFEMRMIQDIYKKEFPGTDAETLHHFRTCYLTGAVNIFQTLGQTPKDIAKVTKKVIESPRPPFRNLTNPLYTPIVAMKYADTNGSLSVHTFYHMLYNLGGVMSVGVSIMKCLSCGWIRRRTISPT